MEYSDEQKLIAFVEKMMNTTMTDAAKAIDGGSKRFEFVSVYNAGTVRCLAELCECFGLSFERIVEEMGEEVE